ncbi:Gallate 1-beta-glucosyltransferase [Bienertia sinuspersici]
MEEENPKPTIDNNVLMVAFASQGHINPMLRLGKHLQTKGIHVTLATTEIFRRRIINLLTTTTAEIPFISGIDIMFFSDGLSQYYDPETNLDIYMETLAKHGPINLTNLIINLACENISPQKFSCIITNPFLPWVTDVASNVGYALYNNLTDFPTKEEPNKSVILPNIPLFYKLVIFPLFIAKIFFEVFKNIHKFKWIIANSFYELEKEVINYTSNFLEIKTVGPLVPLTLLGQGNEDGNSFLGIDMWKADDNCIEWLNTKDPNSVIYVPFGSLVVLSKAQMESIAMALKASKRSFIWVVKPADYLVAGGGGVIPEGFMGETKEQGLVVPWCPQTKVLSHKSIACFVTHCAH